MAALAGVILLFITAAVCYTIGMRYLFTKTTIWLMQTTEYALLWIVFLATTWLLREKGHITTDVIYTHLNEKTKRYLDCIMFIIGGVACAFMVYFGIDYMRECIIKGGNRRKGGNDSEMDHIHHHPHRQHPPYHPVFQDDVEQVYRY